MGTLLPSAISFSVSPLDLSLPLNLGLGGVGSLCVLPQTGRPPSPYSFKSHSWPHTHPSPHYGSGASFSLSPQTAPSRAIDPTQQHPSRPPLHRLPNLHNPAIGTDIHPLPHCPQPPHIPLLLPPHQPLQLGHTHPHPPGGFTHQLHLLQHGVLVAVFQPDPEAPGGDVGLCHPPLFSFHLSHRPGRGLVVFYNTRGNVRTHIPSRGRVRRQYRRDPRGGRRGGAADRDVVDVAEFLHLEEEGVQLVRAREGG